VGDRAGAARLRLAGRFDAVALSALDEVIRETRDRDVVMDLGGLTFIDGAAWLAVMAFERRVRDWGGAFRVVNVHGRIRKIFELTQTEYLLAESISR
jgi:anti-anti-sigma factor